MPTPYWKYKKGYILLDDEKLYSTESGNWSEVENIKEYKGSQRYWPEKGNKKGWTIIGIAGGLILGVLIYCMINEKFEYLYSGALGMLFSLPYIIRNWMFKRHYVLLSDIVEMDDDHHTLYLKLKGERNTTRLLKLKFAEEDMSSLLDLKKEIEQRVPSIGR